MPCQGFAQYIKDTVATMYANCKGDQHCIGISKEVFTAGSKEMSSFFYIKLF